MREEKKVSDTKALKAEKKAMKKAFKKAKRKFIQPWKALSIFTSILLVIALLGTFVINRADNTMAIVSGGTYWELENEDESAVYYEGDYATTEERIAAGKEIVYQTEAEGAALLVNDNNALPLDDGNKISLFSSSSVNVVYGGTGSANVDASTCDNLKQAAEKSGFEINETLWNFYAEGEASEYVRVESSLFSSAETTIAEVPWDVYTDDVKASFAEYGDAAVVVLSRVGGEDDDLQYTTYNYLELNDVEREMLENVKALKNQGVFKKVIVLVNTSNALEMDFLQGNPYGIDAVMWIGGVGASGLNAVMDIMAGKINPSGSLVDTYCYDNFSAPAMVNFAPTMYGGWEESGLSNTADTYMIYQEGIYVGYKYYETRYEDAIMGTGNTAGYDYDAEVAFPFGYGLSYTSFEYSDFSAKYNAAEDVFDVTVKVTNTGDVAGKETIQIYGQSPYTQYDIDNGVEKAAVQLVGFEKTDILEPGKSEVVKLKVDRYDLASYDANKAQTYIFEDGTYYLTAATDAHNAVNNILVAKGYDVEGNADLTAKYVNDTFDAKTYSVSANGTEITNQVSDTDLNYYEGDDSVEVTYLSRNDWEGTYPTEIIKINLTEQMIDDLQALRYDSADYETVDMPTMGAENELNLYDMIGLDYDDPKWEEILDQLTFEDMINLIGDAFHWTMPVESINAPGSRDENGPQGLTARLFPIGPKFETVALTSEDVMGATFNRELINAVGKVIGNDCVDNEVAVLYGPGSNIHRTAYSGRNFEYFSEDGYLSGEMTNAEVAGIAEYGVKVVIKHFALNDHEEERVGISIWANEQSIREIYLKAFQDAMEADDTAGVMTSYTRWGTTWSGATEGLIDGIMRGEWGSKGIAISDNCRNHMDAISGVMAGSTAYDDMMNGKEPDLAEYENDPVAISYMREACHYNLYVIANSMAMNGVGADTTVKAVTPDIVKNANLIRTILIVLVIVFFGMYIWKKIQFKKTEEYKTYKEFKKSLKKH